MSGPVDISGFKRKTAQIEKALATADQRAQRDAAKQTRTRKTAKSKPAHLRESANA